LTYLHPERNKWIPETIDKFIEMVNDVVFLAEVDDNSGEVNYFNKKKTSNIIFAQRAVALSIIPILVLAVIVLGTLNYGQMAIPQALYLLLAFIGTVLSVLLLWSEIDHNNRVLRQVCSAIRNSSCEDLLFSK